MNRGLGRLGPRAVAVGAMVVLTATYLAVLYEAVNVAGDVQLFTFVVAGAFASGLVLGRYLPDTLAVPLGLAIAIGGALLYVPTIPNGDILLSRFDLVFDDVVALLTGLSILKIINAGVWATAFAPVPVFLSWFFVGRRRYPLAALVGLSALVFFILTSDAGVVLALFGVLAAATAVGVGDVDLRGGRLADADGVAMVVAAMVVLTVSVSLVPGGASQPLLRGGGGAGTIESSLTQTNGEVTIQGPISLSPEVRFRVDADEQRYWKVASYDRYTGDGWVRTAAVGEFDGSQAGPPGPTNRLVQTVTAETELSVLPAAWKATNLDGEDAQVTGFGGLQTNDPLSSGERYEVVSRVSTATPDQLRNAGTDYEEINVEQYTRLPESTPQDLTDYTSTLTSNADNSYDTARIVEDHLEEKSYSLDVQRPSGDIASSFLFEMESGYCTYYATTMVAMLRSQGIPARFVTGYTPGQNVDGEYVVRGLNAHAWVEVYFPGYGWQQFDPTPSGPREATERTSLDEARSNGTDGVDVPGSTPTPTPTPAPTPETTAAPGENDSNGSQGQAPGGGGFQTPTPPGGGLGGIGGGGLGGGNSATNNSSGGGGGFSLPSPTREEMALGGVVLLGVAAAVRRSGAADRAYRVVWLRHQPRTDDPVHDIERAHERMEYLLARERRPRRTGETYRRYLRSLGDRDAMRVGEIYEQAVYAGKADGAAADEAVERVSDLVGKYRRF